MNYLIPGINDNMLIINPTVTINGQVGGNVRNNVSIGEYFVDLLLENSGFSGGVRITTSTPPPSWTEMELIINWAVEELNTQYGQT